MTTFVVHMHGTNRRFCYRDFSTDNQVADPSSDDDDQLGNSPADRNLLLGVLALQAGVLTQEQLVSAMQAWTLAKATSLGAILVQQDVVSESQRNELQQMVASHVRLHQNDATKALGNLSSIHDVTVSLQQQITDDDMQTSLNHFCATMTSDADPISGPRAAPVVRSSGTKSSSREDSRFRIIRPHARGGLGEVFLAKDEELNREVALKEIQTQFADRVDSRSRFVLEAEVTGGLEHPGIVPVYGLGQYADGRPYYAMRFIKGDSLKDAIRTFHDNKTLDNSERTLQLRQMLGRFIDVCQAISYSHSRGVLHRDLKPGNIMLGKYGETLVVDWGLAKIAGRDESTTTPEEQTLQPHSGSAAPTVMGGAIGTPAYMPPEQAAGKLDELGPASDVYSLGATLYHLLAGHSAFEGKDLVTTLQNVKDGSFPPPRAQNADIPKAIEAVCLKAMSVKPIDRYGSPTGLANDVERFLADEPVSAFKEPVVQRARRWVRKHPTFTAATAATVLISAVGAAGFSSVVAGKNQELQNKNAQLVVANDRATKQRKLALANEQAAREQSQLALETLSGVFTDLQVGLKQFPGGTPVRQRVLGSAIEKLDRLSTKYVDQTSADRQTFLALVEMGDVVLLLSSKNQNSSDDLRESEPKDNFGPLDESGPLDTEPESTTKLALQFYSRALNIAESLFAANPENAQSQSDLANAREKIGEVQLQIGDTAAALKFYHDALQIRETLVSAAPDDHLRQIDLCRCMTSIGHAEKESGDRIAAMKSYQRAMQIIQTVASKHPEDFNAQSILASINFRMGYIQNASGDTASAMKSFENMLKIRQSLADKQPGLVSSERGPALAYVGIGDVQRQAGKTTLAMKSFESALKIRKSLAAADPTNRQAQQELAGSFFSIGRIHRRAGDYAPALEANLKALVILKEIASADPSNFDLQEGLYFSYAVVGDLQRSIKDFPAAALSLKKSLEICHVLESVSPDSVRVKDYLAITHFVLGLLETDMGDFDSALRSYKLALEANQWVISADSSHVRARRNMAHVYSSIGSIHLKLNDTPAALACYQDAFEIRQSLALEDSENADVQFELMLSNLKLGESFDLLGDYSKAVEYYQSGIAILNKMSEKGQEATKHRSRLTDLLIREHNAKRMQLAMVDWDELLEQPAEMLPTLLYLRGAEVQRARQERTSGSSSCKITNA